MSEFDDETDDVETEEAPVSRFPEELVFSLDRQKIPVKLQDPKTGNFSYYTLQELDGTERDKYLNMLGQRMKVGKDGKPQGIKDFKDLQADLVSRSLLDSESKNVPVAMIQRWPVSVQSALFKQAQRLSALEEESEKEVKND